MEDINEKQEELSEKKEIELFSKNEVEDYGNRDLSKPVRSYMPSAFISAALPLRDVKKSCFSRKYNNISLYLTGAPKVPFGVYGRLLLSILTTHAVVDKKTDKGTVVIRYDNIQTLVDEMLVEKQRGKKVIEQLELFAKSSFIFEEKLKERVSKSLFPEFESDDTNFKATWHSYGNMPFLEGFRYLTLEDSTGNKKNISFEVVLNEKFVKLCENHSVPIDYSVYSQISSPLGKDLYAWFVYRNNSLDTDKPLFIPRKSLVEQFMPVGEGAKDKKAMERNNYNLIKERVEEIKEKYYPHLDVTFDKDGNGMTLHRSPNVISTEEKRYMLVTSLGK